MCSKGVCSTGLSVICINLANHKSCFLYLVRFSLFPLSNFSKPLTICLSVSSILTPLSIPSDTPKILGSVTVYTWEGNPANISCEVEAHPGASVVWFRDGFQLPTANSTNMKIYNTPSVSYLEVCCICLLNADFY